MSESQTKPVYNHFLAQLTDKRTGERLGNMFAAAISEEGTVAELDMIRHIALPLSQPIDVEQQCINYTEITKKTFDFLRSNRVPNATCLVVLPVEKVG